MSHPGTRPTAGTSRFAAPELPPGLAEPQRQRTMPAGAEGGGPGPGPGPGGGGPVEALVLGWTDLLLWGLAAAAAAVVLPRWVRRQLALRRGDWGPPPKPKAA